MPEVDLPQELVDELAKFVESHPVDTVAVLEAVERLPDLQYGRGERPVDLTLACYKCDEDIADGDMIGTAMGHIYHDGCVPSLKEGPMPAAQYLAGVEDAGGPHA